jgi:hypothetical protein
MPAPTSYSEDELAEYMIEVLSDIATVLGWNSDSAPVLRAVYAVQRAYPNGSEELADVSEADNMPLLESLAQREGLRAAAVALAARVDIASPAGDARLAQQHTQCLKMLSLATYEADLLLGDEGNASVVIARPVRHIEEPFYESEAEAEL